MDISQISNLLTQIQAGARITTTIGEPITVGERIVIPVVEIMYGGGGGGGNWAVPQCEPVEGGGAGGGGGARVRPLGCWIIGPNDERWLPAVDVNRFMILLGSVTMLLLLTIRALAKHHR